MHGVIFFAILFVAKVIDNALSTAKTILIQRSRWIIAGVIVMLSDVIYFWVTNGFLAFGAENKYESVFHNGF